MRYCRKSKPASDFDTDLSDELRTVQGHIQNLTLVADEVIVECEPRSVRVPTKPAMHSNLKPAGYSDRKPATLGVNRMGRFDDAVGG